MKLQRNNSQNTDPAPIPAAPTQAHQAETYSDPSEEYIRKMQQSHLNILTDEINLNSRMKNNGRPPVNRGRNSSDDFKMLVNFSSNTSSRSSRDPYQDIKDDYHIPLSELFAKFHRWLVGKNHTKLPILSKYLFDPLNSSCTDTNTGILMWVIAEHTFYAT
jgi:hypothetical protein